VPTPTHDGRASVYHFELPYAGSLELTTSARMFTRNVSLQRQRTMWESNDPDKPAPPLVMRCRTTDADLVVDDGDNAPLPITSAKLTFPGYALRFTAPGGPLTLLYGAEIAAPHYDIALISERLLAQPARTIALRPITRNETHVERRVFWIAIAIAVAVLLVVLGRLLVRT
jgi:hypothetical protein